MVTKTSHLPIRYFLALLWAHPILHISTIRVNIISLIPNCRYNSSVLNSEILRRYRPVSKKMLCLYTT